MPFTIALMSEKGYAIDLGSTAQYANRQGNCEFWQGTLGLKDIRRASAALNSSKTTRKLKDKINKYVGLEIARNFAEGKDSNGVEWAPLSEATIRKKTKFRAQDVRTVRREKNPQGVNVSRGRESFAGFTDSENRGSLFQYETKEGKRELGTANIQGSGSKLFLPLVESGDLFKSVTTPITRSKAEFGNLLRISGASATGLVISEKQKIYSQPKR